MSREVDDEKEVVVRGCFSGEELSPGAVQMKRGVGISRKKLSCTLMPKMALNEAKNGV